MGKKSRKGGKKGDKKAHKEKVLERKNRVEEHLDYTEQPRDVPDGGDTSANAAGPQRQLRGRAGGGGNGDYSDERSRRPFLEGDRVWFWDWSTSVEDDYNTYRGVVKSVLETSIEPKVVILPIVAEEDTEERRVILPVSRVVADEGDWTVRFKIGDRVLCSTQKGWVACTVVQLFPPDVLKDHSAGDTEEFGELGIPAYRCKVEGQSDSFLEAPTDFDDIIRRHPTVFRFSVGDAVIFSADKALALPKRYRKKGWITGIVTRVDILEMQEYAAYECEFDAPAGTRAEVCFIANDDDAHIAAVGASPRQRLFDAIEHNCDMAHFNDLIHEYGIDVSAFQDIVVARALEYGNYWILLWLQTFVGVKLQDFRDTHGNTMLHRISASHCAENFIQSAGLMDFNYHTNLGKID